MMKLTNFFLIASFIAVFTSCDTTNGNGTVDSIDTDTTLIDTTISINDTTSILPDTLLQVGYVDETEEVANIIEKKYGKQWDFCDCAVKNDSVNTAIENSDNLSDAEFDLLFTRLDEIDQHCKELLTTANTTPEERDNHKRKIRKCLKNAGK
jgi:hypothetical protein